MTTPNLTGGAWFSADQGCRIRCYRNPDGDVNLIVGTGPHTYEMTFDVATFGEVMSQGEAVLADIKLRAQRRHAEQPPAERSHHEATPAEGG